MNYKIKEYFYQNPFIFILSTCLFFLTIFPNLSKAQSISDYDPNRTNVLAFPGAEGFGRYTTGGRGGQVIKVTNLNDSGPGSLREAINQKGPRIVIFEVSGTIQLKNNLYLKYPDLTISGQTAPGDGITISNYAFDIDADNIIIRFMRFRLGDKIINEYNDPLKGNFRKNIIIDHCSLSWGTDESASFYGLENFTLQWCVISEGLNISIHDQNEHGFGGIWGGKNASFHHNLVAHFTNRSPRFDSPSLYDDGNSTTLGNFRGNVDFRNNVIYNWRDQASRGGETGRFNVINNYYKPGPATIQKSSFLHPLRETSRGVTIYDYGKFFVNGNILENNSSVNSDNWKGVLLQSDADTDRHLLAIRLNAPLPSDVYESTHSSTIAYQRVLDFAGSSLVRDLVDTRVIKETRNGTFTFTGSHGSKNGIIDSQEDVGGWPILKNGQALTDSDGDGIPDSWETANRLNSDKSNDRDFNLSPYYTDIEIYLNSLVQSIINNQNPGVPSIIQTILPTNNASVFPGEVSFAWSPLSTAEFYSLQISKSSAFLNGNTTIENIKSLSYVVSQLDPNSTYFWRIRASNDSGNGSYSPNQTFSTGALTSIPGTSILMAPINGGIEIPTATDLNWSKVPGATSYRLQISTSSSFSSTILDQSNLNSNHVFTDKLSENTTYFWRVRASSGSGTGAYSLTGTFKTVSFSILAGPTLLIRPANNTTIHPMSVLLEWKNNPLAQKYIVQVSTSSSFSTYTLNEANIIGTSFFINHLNSNTTYYWRVRPVNRAGIGSSSTVFILKTSQYTIPPSKVLLKEPIEDSNIFSTSITFSWEKEPITKSYRLQVSTNSDFSSFVTNVSGITNTSFSVSSLKSNSQFYWRVFGNNEAGQGISSNIRKVRSATYSGTPPATVLLSPTQNTTIPSNNIAFVWENQPNSDRYTLQVSTRSDFSSYVVNVGSIKGTSYSITKLDDNKTYFWRVRTANPSGSGIRTLSWTFKTGTSLILSTEPKLLSPINNANNLQNSVGFSWDNVNNASTYGLEISESSSFQSLLVNQTNIVSNNFLINNFTLGETFYWRVYAIVNGVKGNYSQIRSFSTQSTEVSLPSSTILLSPANNSSSLPISLVLTWTQVPTSTSYRLQISTNSTFSSLVTDLHDLVGNSFSLNNLVENTLYFWRVGTANQAGNGTFSETWSFKTGAFTQSQTPGPAILFSPSNNSTNRSRPVSFVWRKVPNATSYRIQIATSQRFGSSVVVSEGNISDTTVTISNLNATTRYFWRIRTPDGNTWGASSEIWNFTTGSSMALRIQEDSKNSKKLKTSPDKNTTIESNYLSLPEERIEGKSEEITAYPNPIENLIYINIPYFSKGLTVIQVVDLSGREILNERLFDFSGNIQLKPPIEKMARGTYLLIIQNQKERKILRLVKN